MNRRHFIQYSSLAALSLVACQAQAALTPVAKKPLPIPPLHQPDVRNGIDHYDLTIHEAEHTFFEGIKTRTYAIDGTFLGPTLVVQRGHKVSINYTNRLQEVTTMHGHGMHVPAIMDGTAHQTIAPGTTWSSAYTVNQRACTNWYHPHAMGKTAEHVYMGMAGLIIIEDDESRALNLPKRYGIDDIPLVLQDRKFDRGQIDYNPSMPEIMHGYVGDTFLVNGAIDPVFDAEAKELRLRILNGSNSSIYALGFVEGLIMQQIATDNAFLEAPVPMKKLVLSPGERAEVVVDLSRHSGRTFELYDSYNKRSFMTIRVNKKATATTVLPARLTTLERLDPSKAVRTRRFVLEGRMMRLMINGKSMNMGRIDEKVPVGQTEIWEVENTMPMHHNFHIHATHFEPIDRDGKAENIFPNERGHKDVILVPSGSTVRFAVRMSDYTDPATPYMYHCHFLEHEDNGMMGQFVTV